MGCLLRWGGGGVQAHPGVGQVGRGGTPDLVARSPERLGRGSRYYVGGVSDVHCPARIIVARHGEAEYETAVMGASGGSLTRLGRAQARELGQRLSSERVAAVVCSELSRAVQTAEIAAGVLGLPVRVRERLQEFPAGDFLGRPYEHGFFDPMVRSWLAGDLSAGVPGGETGRKTADRVLGVLEDLADDFRGETVLVVTHGGVILALWGAIAPGSPEAPGSELVANGSTYVFENDADGWRLGAQLAAAS
jgi:broad specificity phosphatase PhoE